MHPIRAVAAIAAVALSTSVFAATFTVTTTNVTGPGSLEQALLDANANPGRDEIRFTSNASIPETGLPGSTDPVDINGLLPSGLQATVSMPLQADVTAGFEFLAGSSTSTLTNIRMETVPNSAVFVAAGVPAVQIRNNFFGINTIRIDGSGNLLENNTLSLTSPFARILLQGNSNTLLGNTVNTISVAPPAVANQIGGFEGGNIIRRLVVRGPATRVENNTFSGTGPGTAIDVNALNTTILLNSISNYAVGIRIFGTGNEISINSIFDVGIPIDLGNDLATPNDPAPDADTGPNNLQNHPVLTSASMTHGELTVTGTLTSAPLTTYRIELFYDDEADAEARTPMAAFEVTTDAAGNAAFTREVTFPLPESDDAITATATNVVARETSELSAAIPVFSPGTLVLAEAVVTVDESAGTATVILNRLGGSEGTVTVQFATQNGTATAPSDFAATSGTLTFGPGVTTQTIVIPIVADAVTEPQEAFTVVLSNSTGGAAIGNPEVTVVIAANGAPIPTASTGALLVLAAALAAIVMHRL